MKGISAIIVVVMLLLISIALISVVYIWGSGLLTTTTGSVTTSTTETTTSMQKIVNVPSAKCTNDTTDTFNIINFTVQNVGPVVISVGNMQAFVDELLETTSPNDISATTLAKTEIKSFGIQMSDYAASRTLKVVSPSFSMEKVLICE